MPARLPRPWRRAVPAATAVAATLAVTVTVAAAGIALAPVASATTGLTVTPNPILDTGSHTLTISSTSGLYLQTPHAELVGPSPADSATYTGSNVSYDSSTGKVTATFAFPSGGAVPGSYTFEVCAAVDTSCSFPEDSGTVAVDAPPHITGVSPGSAGQGATAVPLTISGTGFEQGAQVSFGGGTGGEPALSGVTVNQAGTTITGTLAVPAGASPGSRDVNVTNPDTGTATDAGALQITAAPTVSKLSPVAASPGATFTAVLTGSGFVAGTSAAASTSVTAPDVTFAVDPASSTATKLVAQVSVAASAARGPRSLTVANPDGGTSTCSNCFLVDAAPTAPQDLTATLSGTTATLSWQPPADDGGSQVAYSVSASPTVTGLPKMVSGTSITVGGLQTGMTYTFSVAAVNAAAAGPAATTQVTVPRPPALTVVAGRGASGDVALLNTSSGAWMALTGLSIAGDPAVAGTSSQLYVVAQSARDHGVYMRVLGPGSGAGAGWQRLSRTSCSSPGAAVSGQQLWVGCRSAHNHLLLGSVRLSAGRPSGRLRLTDEGGRLTSGVGLAPVGVEGVVASFTERAYDKRGDNTYSTLSFDEPRDFARSNLACSGRPGVANAGSVFLIGCASGRHVVAEYGSNRARRASLGTVASPGAGAALSPTGTAPTVYYVHDRQVSGWRASGGSVTPYPGAEIVGGVTAIRLH